MQKLEEISVDPVQQGSESVVLLVDNLEQRLQNFSTQLIDAIQSNRSLFRDYLVLAQHYHKQPERMNWRQIIISMIPVFLSYSIGGIATIPYVGAGKNAAGNNKFSYYMNPISSVILNGFVNGYFFNEVVSEIWNEIFKALPNRVKIGLFRLQSKNPSTIARIFRNIKNTVLFCAILAPAFLSAYPFYVLDKEESDDPEAIGALILISATMLQFKGVEAFLYKALPAVYNFFRNSINYCFNPERYEFDLLLRDIAKFKSAHQAVLENAHQQFLSLLQTRKEQQLDPIYNLLKDKNPDLKTTLQLLLHICEMGLHANPQSPNRILLKLVQFLSLIMTTASLPGYFLQTESSAAKFFEIEDRKAEFLLGAAIYFITVALSYDVSWDVFGTLYEKFVYAKNGIKQNWYNSASTFDFLKNMVTGILDKKSWHTIVQLPLAVQQSPKFMYPALSFFYGIAYWSVNISNYLNEKQLGETIANVLFVPTVISVLAFNLFPVNPVTASAQQFYVKTRGTEQQKIQLKLEEYIFKLIAELKNIKDANFLYKLNYVANLNVPAETKEEVLKTFLGGKAKDILGEKHPFANRSLCEVINRMVEKYEDASLKLSKSRFSLFKSREQKLINEEELSYGTFQKSYSAV